MAESRLKECWNKFLEMLDDAILNILKNFLNSILAFIAQMILLATLDYLKAGKDLLALQAYSKMIEAVYQSILSMFDTLAEYVKQFDYCDTVGDFNTTVRTTLDSVVGPVLRANRKVREHLMFQNLKQMEINTLNEYKSKIEAMINSIDFELARRAQK